MIQPALGAALFLAPTKLDLGQTGSQHPPLRLPATWPAFPTMTSADDAP